LGYFARLIASFTTDRDDAAVGPRSIAVVDTGALPAIIANLRKRGYVFGLLAERRGSVEGPLQRGR